MSNFTVTLNDGPTITIGGWGHTHLNKLGVLDNLTEEHLAFLDSGTIGLDDYYNKITDTASSISLNTDNFNNNLDASIDDAQKLADAVDNMAAEGLPVGGTENDLLQGDGTWQPKNKSLVGLDQVDNTSDAVKVVSGPQQAEIDTKKDNFSENSAFNKNFGITAETVAQGDHLHSGIYDTIGSAETAVSDHESALDPHPQYYDSGPEVKAAYESLANTNAYTDAEKSKLSSLESSKFLGTYVSLIALESAHSSPAEGSYGHVDTGVLNEVAVYIWDSDDNKYYLQMGASSAETSASVKAKYESNPDTNAFTDSEKNNLSNQSGINTGDVDVSGAIEIHKTDETHVVKQPSEYSICTLDSERIIGSAAAPLDIAKMMDYHWSAGMFNGGALSTITVNDPEDGSVNLAQGAGLLRENDSETARLILVSIPAESNIILVDNEVNYIYADYNSGSPIHAVTTNIEDFNCKDKCVMYRLSREGNRVNAINLLAQNVDANRKGRRKDFELEGIILVPNTALLADAGSRYFTVSAGKAWFGKSTPVSPVFDTSGIGTFELYYGSGSTWASTFGNAQVDNFYYNDGTTTPAVMGVGRANVSFAYLLFDEIASPAIAIVAGSDFKNADEASGAIPPAVLPPEIGAVGVYIGKIVVEKSAAEIHSIYLYSSGGGQSFIQESHNDLPGIQGGDHVLGDHYHNDEPTQLALTDANAQLAELHTDGNPRFGELTVGPYSASPSLRFFVKGQVQPGDGLGVTIEADESLFGTGGDMNIKGGDGDTYGGDVTIAPGDGTTANGELNFYGQINYSNWSPPLADGTAGQVLSTDGAGTGSWTDRLTATTTVIAPGDWTAEAATKTVAGVTAANIVFASPAPASVDDWADAGIIVTGQGANELSFSCKITPVVSITVNIAHT